jgi:hypothetical protein
VTGWFANFPCRLKAGVDECLLRTIVFEADFSIMWMGRFEPVRVSWCDSFMVWAALIKSETVIPAQAQIRSSRTTWIFACGRMRLIQGHRAPYKKPMSVPQLLRDPGLDLAPSGRVRPRPTVALIVAATARQYVVPIAAEECVVAVAATQRVIAVPPSQNIVTP